MLRTLIRATLVAGILAASAVTVQSPAAAFYQTWSTSASYRASGDWLPANPTVTPYGKACSGGDAYLFNISILRTSNSGIIWNSSNAWADGQWWHWNPVGVQIGTSYYFRWRGLNASGNTYYGAPCQGVQASVTV
ncbi:hypothetical protein [Catellatospora methionotrophica]|uniref:hypothetical protein n=1 Tax=Catellatospora methionotrophica TaxID=121620 RepID=UPI0014075DD0|nr:hypothetical protein [Catellatospora methionotrophica]